MQNTELTSISFSEKVLLCYIYQEILTEQSASGKKSQLRKDNYVYKIHNFKTYIVILYFTESNIGILHLLQH